MHVPEQQLSAVAQERPSPLHPRAVPGGAQQIAFATGSPAVTLQYQPFPSIELPSP
jgi:hypothetical protein